MEKWKCIEHVKKVETDMWQIGNTIDNPINFMLLKFEKENQFLIITEIIL